MNIREAKNAAQFWILFKVHGAVATPSSTSAVTDVYRNCGTLFSNEQADVIEGASLCSKNFFVFLYFSHPNIEPKNVKKVFF